MVRPKADQLATAFGGEWAYLDGTCRWDCTDGRYVVLREIEIGRTSGEIESVFFYVMVDDLGDHPIRFTGSRAERIELVVGDQICTEQARTF